MLKTVPLDLIKHSCVHARMSKFYLKLSRFAFARDRNTSSTALKKKILFIFIEKETYAVKRIQLTCCKEESCEKPVSLKSISSSLEEWMWQVVTYKKEFSCLHNTWQELSRTLTWSCKEVFLLDNFLGWGIQTEQLQDSHIKF